VCLQCFSQTKVNVKKLKIQLHTPKKDRIINTYLLNIKKIVETLTTIGSHIFADDHVEAILDGLIDEYDN